MPVTIKKSQLMYKNPSTGEYVSVDAVADKTSQQQINGINTAASNAIASINTAMQDIDTQPLTTLPKKAYKKDWHHSPVLFFGLIILIIFSS